MSKKVLIISSSPRRDGNSGMLCDEFARGAHEIGHKVESVRLRDKNIHYCNGCSACVDAKTCVQRDDMDHLSAAMLAADVIVLASPVYFYSVSAQLKTFIDRCCSFYTQLKDKEFYYILTAADANPDMLARSVETIRGFTEDCLDGAVERDILYGVGVWQIGDVKSTAYLQKAYEMGKNV